MTEEVLTPLDNRLKKIKQDKALSSDDEQMLRNIDPEEVYKQIENCEFGIAKRREKFEDPLDSYHLMIGNNDPKEVYKQFENREFSNAFGRAKIEDLRKPTEMKHFDSIEEQYE